MSPPLTTSMTVPVTMPSSSSDLLDGAPGALVLGVLLREDQAAFLVLLLENKGFDLVTHGDDLVRVNVVLDRELAARDDTFGSVTDVEQDLVPVDLHDDAVDDVAVVEVLDRLVDRGEEGFLVTDVDATCGVAAVVSVLLVMWERAPVRTVSRRYCLRRSPFRPVEAWIAKEAPNPVARRRLENRGDIHTDASAACYV